MRTRGEQIGVESEELSILVLVNSIFHPICFAVLPKLSDSTHSCIVAIIYMQPK